MSYTIVPKQTPHVPELDWDNAVTETMAPGDVVQDDYTHEVYNAQTGFSGVVSYNIPSSWRGTVQLIVSKLQNQTAEAGDVIIKSYLPSGSGGESSPFSKGDWVKVFLRRTASSKVNFTIYFVPYKGQF